MENIYHVRLNQWTETVIRWATPHKVELTFSAVFMIFYVLSGSRLHAEFLGAKPTEDSELFVTGLLGWLNFVLQLPLSNRLMLGLFAFSGWVLGTGVRMIWRKPSTRLTLITVTACILFLNTATFCGAVLFLAPLP